MSTSAAKSYNAIADALNDPSIQAIELIPGDTTATFVGLSPEALRYGPCVMLDGHLGIPQKALYAAYGHVCTICSTSTPLLDVSLTAILLLANPAHRTALNARKRAVIKRTLHEDHELQFMSMLLSGIKDASKQDMLWHHRRWILSRIYPPQFSTALDSREKEESFFTPPRDAWNAEMNIISLACELYPRNYHAWSHRTLCVRSIAREPQFADLLQEEVAFMKKWTERHVSDASAVHHMVQVISLSASHLTSSNGNDDDDNDMLSSLNMHAASLVQSYPDHEALWTYLRFALALLPLSKAIDAREGMVREVTALHMGKLIPSNGGNNPPDPVRWNLDRFKRWSERDRARNDRDLSGMHNSYTIYVTAVLIRSSPYAVVLQRLLWAHLNGKENWFTSLNLRPWEWTVQVLRSNCSTCTTRSIRTSACA